MSAWWRLLLCLAGVALATVVLQRVAMRVTPVYERLLSERGGMGGKPRHPLGDAMAGCCGLVLAGLFLLLTGRPFTSALLALSVIVFLLLINYAKLLVLREHLILADAWLLRQVFCYPHLYFPFLPVRAMGVVLAGVCACVAFLLYVEDSCLSPAPAGVLPLLWFITLSPALALALLRLGKLSGFGDWLLRRCPVSHDAAEDARRCGPFASAFLHPVLAGKMEKDPSLDFLHSHTKKPGQSRWPAAVEVVLAEADTARSDEQPHIVLVQAESLCDPRTLLSPEQNVALGDFLPHLNALERAGQLMPTPESAFGAYTMRMEFSLLTGLPLPVLGPFAHNPYLRAARRPYWSLARHLASQGYDAVCLHPYAKDFFRRDRVMPNLGFTDFVGEEDLSALERFGPYVSDQALGQWMLARLEQTPRPAFFFVITMEAHGPWLPGRLTEEQIAALLPAKARPLLSMQTQLYLCHLRNLDRMVGLLLAAKDRFSRPLRLLMYGDHAPSLHNPQEGPS